MKGCRRYLLGGWERVNYRGLKERYFQGTDPEGTVGINFSGRGKS
ncbi:MAG: hypothetical protein WC875_06005 [Candidatus Absconditabacterales bacterium]